MTQYTNQPPFQPPFQPPYGMPPAGAMPPLAAPPAGPRKFSYVRAMVCSAFSKELWVDVARNWRGIGLLYMILLLALTWTPVLIKAQMTVSKFIQQDAQKLAQDFSAGSGNASLQDVMMSLQKANLSFQQMVQVRNRLVSAYHDIMNMQV